MILFLFFRGRIRLFFGYFEVFLLFITLRFHLLLLDVLLILSLRWFWRILILFGS